MKDLTYFYVRQLDENGEHKDSLSELNKLSRDGKRYSSIAIRQFVDQLSDIGYLEKVDEYDDEMKELKKGKGHHNIVFYRISRKGQIALDLTEKLKIHEWDVDKCREKSEEQVSEGLRENE